MKFHQIFKAAFHEPKKLAAFRLLSIGKVFRYIFLFVALFTGISFIRYLALDTAVFESITGIIGTRGNNWLAHLPDCLYSSIGHQHFLYFRSREYLCLHRHSAIEIHEKTW